MPKESEAKEKFNTALDVLLQEAYTAGFKVGRESWWCKGGQEEYERGLADGRKENAKVEVK
jgi:hypothetical protein